MTSFDDVAEDVRRAIGYVRGRIDEHGSQYAGNALATCYQLVLPVLRAFGWEVDDPATTGITATNRSERVRIVLRRDGGAILLEVNALGIDRMDRPARGEIVEYLIAADEPGASAAVFTDGDAWVVHRSSDGWRSESKRLLSSENFEMGYWLHPRLQAGRQSQFGDSAVSNPNDDGRASRPSYPVSDGSTGYTHPGHDASRNSRRLAPSGMLDLSDPMFKANRHSPPLLVIDHLGNSHETRHWIDLLVVTANALIEDNRISRAHCPIKIAGNRDVHLINTIPFHTNGRGFHNPKQISGGYFLEANLYVRDCYHNARFLLQFADIPLTAVKFSVDHTTPTTHVRTPAGLADLSDRTLESVVSGKHPPSFFIDHLGVSHSVQSWAHFYRTAINSLIDDNKINQQDCPIKRKAHLSRCLISDTTRHPNGRRIKNLQPLKRGMFLEGDFGAIDFIRNLRALLDHARLPHNSIKFGYYRD